MLTRLTASHHPDYFGEGGIYSADGACIYFESPRRPGTSVYHLATGRVEAAPSGYKRHWSPIDPDKLRVGDLVRVKITLRAPRAVHNVAVVDALPGGLEVENPRLATSALPMVPGGGGADHVEFLDDRVVLFCSALPRVQTFEYALRATTAGRFDLPPIQASCMYDAAVAALGKGGRVRVRK